MYPRLFQLVLKVRIFEVAFQANKTLSKNVRERTPKCKQEKLRGKSKRNYLGTINKNALVSMAPCASPEVYDCVTAPAETGEISQSNFLVMRKVP